MTLCKVLCRPVHVSIKIRVGRTVLRLKKDWLEYVKSHRKGSEIYRFSRSATGNSLRRSSMVAEISHDFEPHSKKFLATPLKARSGSSQISMIEKIKKNHYLDVIQTLLRRSLFSHKSTIIVV